MRPLTDILRSGLIVPLWKNGNDPGSGSTTEIRSWYQLARTIVTRAEEIEKDKKKRILVVDDEPLSFDLIREFLEESNIPFELLTGRDGIRGYEMAVTLIPDLIITDLLMPTMDGLELIRQLKLNPVTKEIPVIMTTGAMTPREEFDEILEAGAIDYMRKPIDSQELKARVKSALVMDELLKSVHHHRDSLDVKEQIVNYLMNAAPNPLFYQDKWGRFLGCNSGFEKLVNCKKQNIIGKSAGEFLPQDFAQEMNSYFMSITEWGVVNKFDMQLADDDGNVKHLVMSYVGIGCDTEEVIIGSVTDITHVILSGQEALTQLQSRFDLEKRQITMSVGKLQEELDFKRRELTHHLELLIHSRNVKEKLIEEVAKLQPFLNLEGKSRMSSLLKQLHWELNDEVTLNMEKKFDEMHADFYSTMEKICPEITKNEKRLCAYLKMNHNATDVAKITDKSLNSVNVGFARLRTKLGIPSNKDLKSFLKDLSPKSATEAQFEYQREAV